MSLFTAWIASLVVRVVRHVNTSRFLRDLANDVLSDDAARDVLLHRLGTYQMHDTKRIDESMPSGATFERFEDLVWLLSSNYANRGLALLMLDETLWLYRTIRSLGAPTVAELGRAKGGTTFLMAAAGAKVVSIDNRALEAYERHRHGGLELEYDEALKRALSEADLADRVKLVIADALEYAPPTATFDIVYDDIPLSTDLSVQLFERWWPAVAPGGRMILRDGREPRTEGTRALVEVLGSRADVAFDEPAPGKFVVVVATD